MRAAGVFALLSTQLALPSLLTAIPAEERLANLSIRRWGAESGLPEETFADLLAPGDGYVWLASNHGLVRFDGQRAEVFRLGDAFRAKSTGNCTSSTLSALLRGADGVIWAGSAGGCLFRLAQDRFGSFANFLLAAVDTPGGNREANGVMALRQPHSGPGLEVSRRKRIAVLRQSDTTLLGTLDATNLTAQTSNELPLLAAPLGAQILLSARDQTGGLWATMSDQKLYHAPPGAAQWTFAFAPPAAPRRVLVGRDGFVWVATNQGLYRWRDGQIQHWGTAQGLPQNEILAMREDRAGCIWMGLAASAARLCGDRLESVAVGIEDEETLATIDEDPQGNVWFGGRWGNLYRLSPRNFRIYTRQDGLPESHLTGVAVDHQGQVWGSLRNSGLARLVDGRVVETYNSPSIAETQTLLPHPDRGILAAGTPGLFVVDQRGVRPLPLQTPINFRSLPALFAPSPDQILYSNSTSSYRLRRQPRTASAESWAVDTLTGPGRLRQFTRDAQGRIWALAQYEGLHWLDGDTYRPAENAPAARARAWYSITVDHAGLLWIGTTSGLEIYSPQEKRFLTPTALLPTDQVFHISLDRFGKIWCATRLGLVRFARHQALAANAQSPLLVERFGDAQSLPTTNFGLVTSATGATDHQGHIWFPGLRGLVSVNPADFERIPRPPAAFLLRVSNDGTPLNLNANQPIPPGSKKLEFVFQTVRLDPLGGEFCRLQMQGFDPDWLPCNERRTAQYTSLPPGPYEFVLQSSSQADQWNGQPLRMPLSIEPAYHQIAWVRALAALFLASILGTIVWRRHRQSRQRTHVLEEKVEERTVKLESAMRAAHAANRAKTEFLATMSHEIRTPMNGVLGAVQLLGSSTLSPDQRQLVSVIQQSGEDLVGIVDDILNLSKVEAGLLTLEKSSVHLPALCENLVALFAAKAEAKGVAVRLLLAPSVPPYILSDPQRLRQILLNLVGNAVKFTDAGEVRLRVTADLTDATLSFHIEDTGLGIPADKLPSLFDPFVQADSSTTRRFGGSGLGLSIVRRFIEAMQGSITVESEPGLGSTFLATFPLELAPTPVALPEPQPAALPPLTTGRTVLLAEDNAVNRLIFQKMLLRLGYLVRTANQGHEALAILRTEKVDLVLMDCQMPDLDGYETTRELRTWGGPFADLPIIALTASAMDEDRERCIAAGMNDFLSKPVILATLAATLDRWSHPAETSI
ncbi:MAG: ATP-binding protein [Acidobacteria bacterium]|nr:ATP-binding protein [Acidobacteriota bacterium]